MLLYLLYLLLLLYLLWLLSSLNFCLSLLLYLFLLLLFFIVVVVLGPFTHAQMSVWHEHGYLDGALQVKRGVGEEEEGLRVEDFQPLSNYIGSDF